MEKPQRSEVNTLPSNSSPATWISSKNRARPKKV